MSHADPIPDRENELIAPPPRRATSKAKSPKVGTRPIQRRATTDRAAEGERAGAPLDERRRGRGAVSNPTGRFEPLVRALEDDGWGSTDELPALMTQVQAERARTIISRNDSPDITFDRSINPYRGCEHGCIYCFARPSHAFVGLSPGLDFETKLFFKPDAQRLLERELAAPNYQPKTIAMGTNTDPYQPIERDKKVTRSVLEVLARTRHPIGIVTKSALVLRDLDLLAPMAADGLAKVAISLTTLDPVLARRMEPRAASPERRLKTIEALAKAGVPVTVLTAPIVPGLNDAELELILTRARAAGAREAGYVMLRLPLELREMFGEWLLAHYPNKFRHVFSLIRDVRGGKTYDATWGQRLTGSGPYAWMIGRRFEAAAAKLGYPKQRARLRTDLFTPPPRAGEQLRLF